MGPARASGSGVDVGFGGTVGVAAGKVGAGVGITVGITAGIFEGVGGGSSREALVGAGVAGRVTDGVAEVGWSISIPAGAASSPPHAAKMRIIDAAAGNNLAVKVRTRIHTLPLPSSHRTGIFPFKYK